jgi:7,8-dihydropterin-6-yl-methyl-4-(beta-D-ribofuranosyl)aminobenzene 5'-phosphate synthase
MNLTVLTENVAGGKFLAEHGLSYLIEIDGEQILFDTGHSDVFVKNAQILGIDLHQNVQKIILSHGHWDHGDGLQYLKNKILITHPDSFVRRFHKTSHSPVGLSFTKEELLNTFKLTETKESFQITENLFYLGEIPRNNNFESKATTFEFENGEDDYILDDLALAAKVNNKLVVITGCSHSGICNICEQAKNVTGISEIHAVIGGFHLKQNDYQTQETIAYFKNNNVEELYPSHCTELPVLARFHAEFNTKQVKTGMIVHF